MTFEVQRDNSTHYSTIRYYRLDTQSVEEFALYGGSVGYTRLHFDGKTLTCFGNSQGGECNSLHEGQHVPVVIFSINLKAHDGYSHTLNTNSNKYSLRGSHYSAICAHNGMVHTIS